VATKLNIHILRTTRQDLALVREQPRHQQDNFQSVHHEVQI
jgi:hypothetical protein